MSAQRSARRLAQKRAGKRNPARPAGQKKTTTQTQQTETLAVKQQVISGPGDVMQLQQSVGNQAVQRLLARPSRVIQRTWSPLTIAEMRGQTIFESAEEEEMPLEAVEAADAAQKIKIMAEQPGTEYGDTESFGEVPGAAYSVGGLKLAGETAKVLGGGQQSFAGIRNLTKSSRLNKNLGAHQLERGAGNVLSGGINFGEAMTNKMLKTGGVVDEVPVLDAVANYADMAIKGKAAIEDSITAQKLANQNRQVKGLMEKNLDAPRRRQRFREFKNKYDRYQQLKQAAKDPTLKRGQRMRKRLAAQKYKAANFKRGEYQRAKQFVQGGGTESQAINLDKQFGRGKQHRRDFKQEYYRARERYIAEKDRGVPGLYTAQFEHPGGKYFNYHTFREMHKVNKFARRRKAESATINAVEAAGHALDATGTFTAGADLGATKFSGKALKAGSALYKGGKKLGKRARRVHKLRKAKNLAGYGGKRRGVLWGAKTFFTGSVATQQSKLRKAIGGLGAGQTSGQVGSKTFDVGTNKTQIKKLLTTQALRRAKALISNLESRNAEARQQAIATYKALANNTLAGRLMPTRDSDLDLITLKRTNPPEYKKAKKAIKQLFLLQVNEA